MMILNIVQNLKNNNNQIFHWIDIDKLNEFEVYPQATINLIKDKNDGTIHLIERKEKNKYGKENK